MILKLLWAQKRMFWAFEKSIFRCFFSNYWVTKLKPFSRKVSQSERNCLNQNLAISSILENSFEATLSSKTNVLSVWKRHFSVQFKFLSDEVETVFWESETEPSKSSEFKVDHRKLLRKRFWSDLRSKTNVLSI